MKPAEPTPKNAPTEENVFDNLMATTYQLTAQDRLTALFGLIGNTGVFEDKVGQIRTRRDFDAFLNALPDRQELEGLVKSKIAQEYRGLEANMAEIAQARQKALESPEIDYGAFGGEFFPELNKRYRLGLDDMVGNMEEFHAARENAVQHIANILGRRVRGETGEFRLGDQVEVVKMTGIDYDNPLDSVYYYEGDEEDVPLGSKGDIIEIVGDEQLAVAFDVDGDYREWQVHPGEIRSFGQNKYTRWMQDNGQDTKRAAEALVKEMEDTFTPKYLDRAREQINAMFDDQVRGTAQALVRKFNLSADQLRAIQAGHDYKYEVPEIEQIHDHKIPFDSLFTLAYRSLTHKLRIEQERPREKVTDESDLRTGVLKGAGANVGLNQDPLGIAREQMDTLAVLLRKEYSVVKRRKIQQGEEHLNVLDAAIESWMDRRKQEGRLGVKYSYERALLYNDKDVYTAEPFSPPSEELHRVVKLEVGNGCNHAKCTYCTEYGRANFFIRSPEEFAEHAKAVRDMLGDDIRSVQRVFLAGGNILVMPTDKLLKYVDTARGLFHDQRIRDRHGERIHTEIRRIAAFTRTEGLQKKSVRDLDRLVEHGLNMVFWGIESGSDAVLEYVQKGITHKQMLEAGRKMPQTKMQVSTMIMTGLGGLKHYEDHVVQTAKLLNELQPKYITFMSINAAPWSEYAKRLAEEQARGENMAMSPEMVVEQMYDMVTLLKPKKWRTKGGNRAKCLIAAYRLPVERIAANPTEFRGRLEYDEQGSVLRQLTD
ncbi:MAG: radical SAM protein [Nanoarchaeota archaeon]|nr:radical SAM protein [Nanoarchaeota archaeon]